MSSIVETLRQIESLAERAAGLTDNPRVAGRAEAIADLAYIARLHAETDEEE